jgi:hypothetical protein
MNTSWYQDAIASSLESSKWEHLPIVIYEQPRLAASRVAAEIADLIRHRDADGLKVVLGLATGSTPIYVYQELARLRANATSGKSPRPAASTCKSSASAAPATSVSTSPAPRAAAAPG